MSSLRLPRLSRPGVLESIAPHRLMSLLNPFEGLFASRSVAINPIDSIDCQAIIRAIMQADRDTPAELLDAICIIDELANAASVDQLLDRVSGEDLSLESGGKHTEADILTAAWLHQREHLLQIQARTRFKRARSFDYFQSIQNKPPKFVMPSASALRQLEQDVDSWYVERYRGQGAKVEVFDNGS